MPEKCMKCGASLSSDEVGLYLKLVNRGADEYMCVRCLAAHFKTSEEKLRSMIELFRSQGCTLFN